MVICEWCNEAFAQPHDRGPTPKFCSAAHRQAAHRARCQTGGLMPGLIEPGQIWEHWTGKRRIKVVGGDDADVHFRTPSQRPEDEDCYFPAAHLLSEFFLVGRVQP